MIICIASDHAMCPAADQNPDWSLAAVLIVLILAIAAFKTFKVWAKRKYPRDGDVDD
jgi:hypothetical protein